MAIKYVKNMYLMKIIINVTYIDVNHLYLIFYMKILLNVIKNNKSIKRNKRKRKRRF